MKPRYRHDCDRCVLLAVTSKGDWYVCDPNLQGGRSAILRHGDNGDEYISSPIAGYTAQTPFIAAALVSGLRLTDEEVREMLGAILSRDPQRAVYELVDDAVDSVAEAIQKAVTDTGSKAEAAEHRQAERGTGA